MEMVPEALTAVFIGGMLRTVVAFMLQYLTGSAILHSPNLIIGIPCCIMMLLNDTRVGTATIIGIFLVEWLTLFGKLIPTGKKA
jgi:hypothetical protein